MTEPFKAPEEPKPCTYCANKFHIYDHRCEGCQKRQQERDAFLVDLRKSRLRPKP